eukprot:scaffold184539_cov27-Tisochrysis_lutea.AAC.7
MVGSSDKDLEDERAALARRSGVVANHNDAQQVQQRKAKRQVSDRKLSPQLMMEASHAIQTPKGTRGKQTFEHAR